MEKIISKLYYKTCIEFKVITQQYSKPRTTQRLLFKTTPCTTTPVFHCSYTLPIILLYYNMCINILNTRTFQFKIMLALTYTACMCMELEVYTPCCGINLAACTCIIIHRSGLKLTPDLGCNVC